MGACRLIARLSRLLFCLCLGAVSLVAQAHAAMALCPEHFAGGRAPDVLDRRRAAGARALCYQAFAILHSPISRTALYSAEHLTSQRVQAARAIPRDSEFHAERALPPYERAELSDYARSGFDRGHLAPSGDMPDPEAQQESFSLANMVPQAPELNRGLWEGIESAVRAMALRRGELYVVTGPIFQGAELQVVGRVLVPSAVWKAVLDPRRRRAAAYVAENRNDSGWRVVSMVRLRALTGLDVFPGLSPVSKAIKLNLPKPTPTRPAWGARR